MARRPGINVCELDFKSQIENIATMAANFINNAKWIEFADDPEGLKKFVADKLAEFTKDLEAEDMAKIKAGLVEEVKGKTRKAIVEILETYKTAQVHVAQVEKMGDGWGTAKQVTNVLKNWRQGIVNKIAREGTKFDDIVNTHLSLEKIAEGGTDANSTLVRTVKDLMMDTISGGRKLIKLLEDKGVKDPNKEIFFALYNGHHSTIPELNLLAKTFRKIDNSVVDKVQGVVPHFNRLGNHVESIQFNQNKVLNMGREKFIEFAKEHINLKALTKTSPGGSIDKNILRVTLEGLYKEITKNTAHHGREQYKSMTAPFGNRKLHFKSQESQYAFFKELGDIPDNFLLSALRHRKNLMKAAGARSVMGPDARFVLASIDKRLKEQAAKLNKENQGKKGFQEIKLEEIDTALNDAATFLESNSGTLTQTQEVGKNVADTLSNAFSAMLVISSALRNVIFDNGFVAAINAAAMKGNRLGGILPELYTAISGMIGGVAKQALKGSKMNEQFNQLSKMFQNLGISLHISNTRLAQGSNETQEAVVGAGWSFKLNRASDWLATTASAVSTADLTFSAARMTQAINMGGLLIDVFGKSIDEIPPRLLSAMDAAGLPPEAMSVIHKHVKRLKQPDTDFEILFDVDSFKDIPDEAVAAFKTGPETAAQTKQRLQGAYESLLEDVINETAAVVNDSNKIVTNADLAKHPLPYAIVRTATKFYDITISQWFNILKAMHGASGLNPNLIAGGEGIAPLIEVAKKDPKYTAAVLSTMMLGGMLSTLAYDIASGKDPEWFYKLKEGKGLDGGDFRDYVVNKAFIGRAFAAGGIGGIVPLIANNLIYDDDIVASPFSAIFKPVKDTVASGYTALAGSGRDQRRAKKNFPKHAIKAARTLVPGTTFYHTRRAFDQFFEWLVPGSQQPTRYEVKKAKELGLANPKKRFKDR